MVNKMSIDDKIAEAKRLVNELTRAEREEQKAFDLLTRAEKEWEYSKARLIIAESQFNDDYTMEEFEDAIQLVEQRMLADMQKIVNEQKFRQWEKQEDLREVRIRLVQRIEKHYLRKQYRDSATMQEDIALVSPKERLDFMLKIHGLTAPKLTSADVTVSTTPHPYIGKPVYFSNEERLEMGLPMNDEEEEEQ